MILNLSQSNNLLGRAGFIFLSSTLFLLSFPRYISLYTIALLIITGSILWLIDYKGNKRYFIRNWYILVPPIFYFIVHLVNLLLQKGDISLLETKLMFFLIPLLGAPLFRLKYLNSRISQLLKLYILGLTIVALFLVVRIIIVFFARIPHDMPLGEYFKQNNIYLVSTNFSILEHPSYLSMKVIFAFAILINFREEWKLDRLLNWSLFILFSITIFMLASKAGIIAWIFLGFIFLIDNFRNRSVRPALYLVAITSLIIMTYISIKHIERISYFIVYTGRSLSQKEFDWKNLDQRTREWYSAIQLIKEEPIIGIGLARVEERMVKEYRKHSWEEEAALKLNAHNQFLETQMTFGIAGSISLLWMLLTPLIFRNRLKYPQLAVTLVLMMSFFLLFESMFNRQWGIMFFMLFYCILGFIPNGELLETDQIFNNK